MAKAKMGDVSLSAFEHNYVKLRSGSPPGRLSRRDGLLAAAALGCLYLLNGQFAEHACTLLTSVPAAVFTYKVLSQPEETDNPGSYRSILFYWVLQGSFGLLDVVLHESAGYFLAKFVLMSLAFGHAASQNRHLITPQPASPTFQEDTTQWMTSVVSFYDTEGYPIQSPLSHSSSAYMDDALTADEFGKDDDEEEDDMMSTQQPSPLICHGINRALTPYPESLSPQESQATVGLAFGDLITNPMKRLVFSQAPEACLVSVSNLSQQNVMWALKCNALHRLTASPACGVIAKGGTEHIRVTCLVEGDGDSDKLAIDYALVDQPLYDSQFIHRPEKKRHLLRIHYGAR